MPGSRSAHDRTMLEMALVGYEVERQKIEEKISSLRGQLGVRAPARKSAARARGAKTAKKKSPLSAAARKRISAAQTRRWAEHRKKVAQEGKAAAKAPAS